MDDPTLKNQFAQEMQDALDRVGGKINIYDTIDLYLAEKIIHDSHTMGRNVYSMVEDRF